MLTNNLRRGEVRYQNNGYRSKRILFIANFLILFLSPEWRRPKIKIIIPAKFESTKGGTYNRAY